jgi:BirA family biotin operon repressor/biotin-[acetyl-CoA-carboxylase] ligase
MSRFDLSRLRRGLRPLRLHWYPRLRSTNDHAAILRRRGDLFAPALVLSGHQTAGRGRGSNVWWSGAGSLTVTFALPIDDRIAPHQVPLIAGLAVRNAAAEITGDDDIVLKWPNDLLYDQRKLGGLLCERINKADLIGLGLNVNVNLAHVPPALRRKMTTLAVIAGGEIDPNDALIRIARHLRETMARAMDRPFAALLKEYDAHHALIGRQVSVVDGPANIPRFGRCQGLDSVGRLVLSNRGTLHRIISGQVTMR